MRLNILTSFTTLLSLTTASINPFFNVTIGNAIVSNNCESPIYLWSVGSTVGAETVIKPGYNYTEPFHLDKNTGGVALKITTELDGLYNSAPQTVFAYNLVGHSVWYDLSDVFGDPFEGETVSLRPSEPEIRWENGVPPSGSQVRTQSAKDDLVLFLC